MAIQFDPQTFLGGLGAQNDFPGNPFSAFSAGIRGALVARALKAKAAKDALDAQAEQDMKDRMLAVQQGQLGVAQGHLALAQQEADDKKAALTAKQNDFLGVLPYGSVGPLAPGEVMAPANVPTGGFKAYAEEAGKAAATPPKPEKDPFDLFVKEQQYKAAHPGAGAAPDLQSYTLTTRSGKKFVNIPSTLDSKSKNALTQAAAKAGLPVPNADQVAGLGVIDAARGNIQDIGNLIEGLLPATPGLRVADYPSIQLQKVLQTDAAKSSFDTNNLTAIKLIQGMAAGGKGLRITQPEINTAIANMPKLTDTITTARAKLARVGQILDNAESPILSKNWGAPVSKRRVYDAAGNLSP